MVLCFQKYSDRRTVRKNCFSDRKKLLKFEAEGQAFAKNLRTIHSNSKRSGQANF